MMFPGYRKNRYNSRQAQHKYLQYALGRKNQDGSDNQHAQAFVAVEQPVTQKIMDEIAAAEGVLRVSLLELD